MTKALLLGAGFVCRPTVSCLSESGVQVTVACRTLESAKKLASGLKNCTATSIDVTNEAQLDAAVAEHDIVISLIPYTHHATVIKSAIKAKRHVVTTSYVSPAMMELNEAAKEAGITVMNEIGLDPGLDHLYAVKLIDEVHRAGGSVTSFLSYCGGLRESPPFQALKGVIECPTNVSAAAPEASDNPLGYKFSWSSRGVLLALRNAAKYYEDGKVVDVKSEDLMGTAKPYFIYPGYAFVCYPNRDSTPYRQRYNIPECQTLIRGTLRYQGFPEFVKCLVDMGFLSDEERDFLKPDTKDLSWKEATAKIIGTADTNESDLVWSISSKTKFANTEEKYRIMAGLRWLGLFGDDPVPRKGNPLDSLCAVLERKMQFEEGERDMVMLQHKFGIEWKDGRKETRTSTLVEYGDPKGWSAMAKLVGVTCAVAVHKVMDGTINERGVLAPMKPEINDPIMEELKNKHGIFLTEKTIS